MTHGAIAPVEFLPADAGRVPEDGIALCLSGGGYRAMLFHVGALWRLNQTGVLASIRRVSSVSGGSIAAGVLGMNWKHLDGSEVAFVRHVVTPARKLARRTLDAKSILVGALLPGVSVADRVASAYEELLFGDATLQDLPADDEGPRFIFNATNVQTGSLWRFSRPYMGDWRVGLVRNPLVSLALAVAASSAFPPVLSPLIMDFEDLSYDAATAGPLFREPFTSRVVLTDGGVYDNLGLETAYKHYKTVLVSDGGGQMEPEEEPKEDWARHSYRVLELIDNQVRSLRKRQLVGALTEGVRSGAFWGIRTELANYGLQDVLPCPQAKTLNLAATPTRLKRMSAELQERLINWGYAVSDAALRRFVDASLAPPTKFPYPRGV